MKIMEGEKKILGNSVALGCIEVIVKSRVSNNYYKVTVRPGDHGELVFQCDCASGVFRDGARCHHITSVILFLAEVMK